jgi:hypothetical protein
VKRFNLILCLLISVIQISGQDLDIYDKIPANQNMVLRIKQFDEFLGRFNYVQDIYGNPISDNFKEKISREKYLNSLLDSEDPRFISGSSEFDPEYLETIGLFISEAINPENPRFINPTSELIFTDAESIFELDGVKTTINLILHQETNNSSVKWVIAGIRNDFAGISTEPFKDSVISILPPNSNETNFMSLHRAFEDIKNLPGYFYTGFENDNLSILLYYSQKHNLKFIGVQEITYYILDIPGWVLVVKEFNRDSQNSGWLISDIIHIDTDIKKFLWDELDIRIR